MSETPRTDAHMMPRCCQDNVTQQVPADFARQLERELADKQAQIDQLMLEYCPLEMGRDQYIQWAAHQKAVPALGTLSD